MKEVTHIVRLDYGEFEFKIFIKASRFKQADAIREEAIEKSAREGFTLPPIPYTSEVYPAPEYDEE